MSRMSWRCHFRGRMMRRIAMAGAVAQEQNGAERADNRGRGLGVVGLGLYKS